LLPLPKRFLSIITLVRRLDKTFKYKKNTPAPLFDIPRAFDTLSWEFLLELLSGKGLSRKWTSWIAGIHATTSTCVLVNGDFTSTIPYRRGLQQVDPHWPLLFFIAMDVLPSSLKQWSRRF
jgi:hypothetical protein